MAQQKMDLYEMTKEILARLKQAGQIEDLELRVVTTELDYARGKGMDFNEHQLKYMSAGRWVTSELGTPEEKGALDEYLRTAKEKNFLRKPGERFVQSEL